MASATACAKVLAVSQSTAAMGSTTCRPLPPVSFTKETRSMPAKRSRTSRAAATTADQGNAGPGSQADPDGREMGGEVRVGHTGIAPIHALGMGEAPRAVVVVFRCGGGGALFLRPWRHPRRSLPRQGGGRLPARREGSRVGVAFAFGLS